VAEIVSFPALFLSILQKWHASITALASAMALTTETAPTPGGMIPSVTHTQQLPILADGSSADQPEAD
jgi:hypothetical protein